MENFFNHIISFIESSKYILLFFGTIVEGPVVMTASGFFYKLGKFDLLPMYFALMSGDFVADIGWYCLGRFGTRGTIFKYGHFVGITPETLEKIEKRFLKYHQKILIISKLTMGLGFALVVLVVAGMFKVPFKHYVILNLIGGFIWTAMLVLVGYFFGNIFVIIPESAKIIFIVLVPIILIVTMIYVTKYLKTKEI